MSENQLREDVFEQLFASGAVRFCDLHIDFDGRAMVVYTLNTGAHGYIYTKRGQIKLYKPDTALRFLRSLGLASVKVEMKDWNPSMQQGVLL